LDIVARGDPAARITSTGKVSWFLEEITLIPLQ